MDDVLGGAKAFMVLVVEDQKLARGCDADGASRADDADVVTVHHPSSIDVTPLSF